MTQALCDKSSPRASPMDEVIQISFAAATSVHPLQGATPASPGATAASRLSAFEIVCLVGKGGFGKVLLVRHRAEPDSLYAMKVMKKSVLASRNAVRDAQIERDVLAMLGHYECPFIVRLHAAFQTEKRVYLVMDFAAGGEIMFHLRQQAMLSEDQARFYAAELLVALEFLHSKRVLHRDIKPENVLLGRDGHLLLTDFGLAKDLSSYDDPDAEQKHSWCGSEDYMAPEIIAREPHTGKPADWWAFGVFLYDCLCGHPPFSPLHEVNGKTPEKKNRKRLHDRILKCKFKLPAYLTSPCHSLLRGLLTRDPNKRLCDPVAIRSHPWFASIDWNMARAKLLTPPIVPTTGSSPTACFSPSLTSMDYSAPHSPIALPNASSSLPIPVPGANSKILLRQPGHQGASPLASPKIGPSTPGPEGVGIWQGFSFVAPGMEVHFELARSERTLATSTTMASTATGERLVTTATTINDFAAAATTCVDGPPEKRDLRESRCSPFASSPTLPFPHLPAFTLHSTDPFHLVSPTVTPCASPVAAFTAPPSVDQLAAEVAEFSLDAEEAVRVDHFSSCT